MNRNLFLILWVMLLGYRINFVGSVSVTELFVITQIPFLYKWMKNLNFKEINKLKNLFILLFCSQLFSEILLKNSFQNAIKGLMITIMAFFVILFFMREIIYKKCSLIAIPIGFILSRLIFGDQFGYAESGDESVYFKFYIVPLVMNGVCVLFLLNNKWINRNVIFIFFFSSVFMMIGGSRTGGFTMLLSLLLYLAVKRYRNLSWSRFLKALIPLLIIAEIFYAFVYVPKVKTGEWGSEQNRMQMASIDYSKNGLMLVMAARQDFFVSFVAFMDKPILGHGAWARDKTLKYTILSAKMSGEDEGKVFNSIDYFGVPLIPCHSILVGAGTRNGILAFATFFCIFLLVYKKSFRLLMSSPPYLPYVCYLIVSSLQAVLFSPPAILKGNIAVMWATLLALYYFNSKIKNNEIICSNRNV